MCKIAWLTVKEGSRCQKCSHQFVKKLFHPAISTLSTDRSFSASRTTSQSVLTINPLTGTDAHFCHPRSCPFKTLRNFLTVYRMLFLSISADRRKVVESYGIFFVEKKFWLSSIMSCWKFDMSFSRNDCMFDTREDTGGAFRRWLWAFFGTGQWSSFNED